MRPTGSGQLNRLSWEPPTTHCCQMEGRIARPPAAIREIGATASPPERCPYVCSPPPVADFYGLASHACRLPNRAQRGQRRTDLPSGREVSTLGCLRVASDATKPPGNPIPSRIVSDARPNSAGAIPRRMPSLATDLWSWAARVARHPAQQLAASARANQLPQQSARQAAPVSVLP